MTVPSTGRLAWPRTIMYEVGADISAVGEARAAIRKGSPIAATTVKVTRRSDGTASHVAARALGLLPEPNGRAGCAVEPCPLFQPHSEQPEVWSPRRS